MKTVVRNIKKNTLLIIVLLAITSCSKNNDASPQNNSSGNNNGAGSSTSTTVTYFNNTLTAVNITVNGQSLVINPGANTVLKGTAGTAVTGSAYTYGVTSSGTQVGLKIAWTISDLFPASGNFTSNLNVGTNFFFLKVVNSSAYQLLKIYVNYGLQAQTVDNVTVPNDGNIYNIGYYSAYSNSNVRAENGNTFWTWNTLNFPGTQNQSVTVTAN